MKLFYKYELPIIESAELLMPIGTTFLDCEIDENKLYIHAVIDQMQTRKKKYFFKILETGDIVESLYGADFLGTVRLGKKRLHVFYEKR